MKNLNSKLGKFFSIIKLGYIKNKISIKVPRSIFYISILKLLFREGYINGFKLKDDYHIIIFLKYHDNRPVFNFINFNTIKLDQNLLSYKCSYPLKKLYYDQGLVVYTTYKGLKTFNECLIEKVGGHFLFQLK